MSLFNVIMVCFLVSFIMSIFDLLYSFLSETGRKLGLAINKYSMPLIIDYLEISKQLEMCCEELTNVEAERNALMCNCKEQEVIYSKTVESVQEQKCECEDLQEALAKCCKWRSKSNCTF